MNSRSILRRQRSGAVLILTAILMMVLIGMVAFAVDLGYVTVVRNELQNAADAAALAGASQLLDRRQLEGGGSESATLEAARSEALRFATLNKVGGKSPSLNSNSSNNLDGDIVVGHLADSANNGDTTFVNERPYNSVMVRIRHDVPRFFDIGIASNARSRSSGYGLACMMPLATATSGTSRCTKARATAVASLEGQIKGFRINNTGPQNSKLLPFALDIYTWKDIVFGLGEDNWTYDSKTNAYGPGSDGIKETNLCPLSNNTDTNLPPGNFGTVDIGGADNSTSDIERQILYGPNKADFDKMGGQFALSSDGSLSLQGDTGVSAGFKDALKAIRGQPRIIPLYNRVLGNGNNAEYTIVGFAGVIITEVVLTGANQLRHLTIQPEFCIDTTAISWEKSETSWFVYKGLALTR